MELSGPAPAHASDQFWQGAKDNEHAMSQMGHSRLGGASCRSSHVRNAPLATVGLKKAACREGPRAVIPAVY